MRLDVFPLNRNGPAGDAVIKTSGYGRRNGRLHRGVDYGTELGRLAGAPVHAPFAGYATRGFQAGGAGFWSNVTTPSGDVFKAFHLREPATTGPVFAGAVIGFVGSTGASTGPHLHAELWTPTGHINPEPDLDEAFAAGRFPNETEEDMKLDPDDFLRIAEVVEERLAASHPVADMNAGKVLYGMSGRAKFDGQPWAQVDTNLGDVINAIHGVSGGVVDVSALAATLVDSLGLTIGQALADELAARLQQ